MHRREKIMAGGIDTPRVSWMAGSSVVSLRSRRLPLHEERNQSRGNLTPVQKHCICFEPRLVSRKATPLAESIVLEGGASSKPNR